MDQGTGSNPSGSRGIGADISRRLANDGYAVIINYAHHREVADGLVEDCNANGTPDECELDSDGDGTIDDCEVPPNYVNLNSGATYELFDSAIADAEDGDSILGLADAVSSEVSLNFGYNCIEFIASGSVVTTASIDLAPCGSFNIEGTGFIDGSVRTAASGTSRIEADDFLEFDASGMVTVRTGSTLEVSALGGSDFEGTTIIRNGGVLSGYAAGGFGVENSGTMYMMDGATLECDDAQNSGTINAQGTVIGNLANTGDGTANGSIRCFPHRPATARPMVIRFFPHRLATARGPIRSAGSTSGPLRGSTARWSVRRGTRPCSLASAAARAAAAIAAATWW